MVEAAGKFDDRHCRVLDKIDLLQPVPVLRLNQLAVENIEPVAHVCHAMR